MDDAHISTSASSVDIAITSISKYDGLIDIPFTTKIADNLVSLFNYFDIYAPKMSFVYSAVTYIRFLQLIGGAFMEANHETFTEGSLADKVINVISVFFYLVPLKYRNGNESIICFCINSILVFFAIYMVTTAFTYKKTSKVSKFSTVFLSIFISFGPFLLVPITADYAGFILSLEIVHSIPLKLTDILAVVSSVLIIYAYIWLLIKAYSKTLLLRPCSFQSIEGSPQYKLFITTTIVTFISSLTMCFSEVPALISIAISIIFYIYSATTVFNCGTFIKRRHEIMVLSGSIIGILLCIANLIIIFIKKRWGCEFFVGFAFVIVFAFIGISFVIKKREKIDLKILDEIENKSDISVIRSKGKFKQILVTGFTYSHPVCINLSIFKMAVENWKNSLDIWSLYGKFAAIYPENTKILAFVAQNVSLLETRGSTKEAILNSANYIIRTRETKYTLQLRTKISQMSKLITKTKNRIRNIWDLVLQTNITEMNDAIKNAQESVNECKSEMNHFNMIYPNNRYVYCQYAKFVSEILCDPILSKESIENLNKLQRGIRIRIDTIYELGIDSFPNLPASCVGVPTITIRNNENESSDNEDVQIEENANQEVSESIMKMIDNHKIPSISFMYLTTILCYLFLIFIPLVILMIMYKFFAKKLEKPIKIMEGIAHTRNIITMLTALVGRYLLQELDDPKNPDKKLMPELKIPEGFNLSCFCGSNTTAKIIDYVASQVSDATEEMSLLRSFEPKNKIINEVRKLLFGINLTFKNYLNNSYYVEIPTTISELSFIIANKAGKLLDIKQITPESAKGSDSLSLRNNKRTSITKMNDALELLIIYVEDKNERYQKIFTAVLCILILLNIIIYPTIYYFQINNLRKNRIQILQSFTLLPKAVISGISASFNKIKDNIQQNDDTDQNRQEESIIKLFASISDGSSKTSIEISTMICFICLIIISCVSYYFAIHSYVVASTDLVHNCHHIHYLLGCITYMYAVMSTIFNIALSTADPIFNETVVNITNQIIELEEEITNLVNYFQFITLGGSESCEIPFKELDTIISNESLCINSSEPPESLLESVHCLSPEQQFFVFTALVMRYYNLMIEKIDHDPRNSTLEELWEIGPMELYQALFYPAEDMIIPVIVNSIEKQGIKQISDSVICIIITFVITIIIIITISEENKLLKFCLKLYLRCPSKALLSNQRIMSLISGNYEYSNEDLSAKHIGFSNEVVNKLNDVVIVCQEMTGKIISVNHTFEVIFGMKKEEVENMSIKDFFTESRFSSKDFVAKALTQKADLVYTTSHGDKFYLEFNITCISGRRIYSGRDLTQHVLHEKLLADERKKSDEILASIIPQMLVPKVHAGDTNISFSVQSATVLFLDVVGFTPWCGSHDAQYVMRMLNIMFKEFDAIANAHKTMTKIKCIGDCYMAAGGIFDEVNQPAVHAKEVVNFGRLVIKKLIKIDENENETLRIRVGINTGGPIVAGVIGTEKPTFELLGPAINIAHLMESHGVPMKVHISRSVYELIYGQEFDIKEHDEIDIKGGMMFTYIVEP